MKITRRNFVLGMSSLAGGVPFLPQAPQPTPSKSPALIRVWGSPDLLETPLRELGRSWITPNDLFFVLNRARPDLSPGEEDWEVTVGGEVDQPFRIPLRALGQPSAFEAVELTAYLQCAGAGRRFFRPPIDDVPWGPGAIGNARWRGVRLADLLRAARPRSTARHVALLGKDASPANPDSYIKSIPLEKALESHTLLAVGMNGAPLPFLHGGPVRALVPGWAGSYSVKWLTTVLLLERPWAGFWMGRAFRVPLRRVTPGTRVHLAETRPFTEFAVNSLITEPPDGQLRRAGPLEIGGFAWCGESQVEGVEVSVDGGRSWETASLEFSEARYAWKRWSYRWSAAPGSYLIRARAADRSGNVQPLEQDNWNPGGYGWNTAPAVRLTVTQRA